MIGQAAFFNGPYDEAMTLLVESRNYVAYLSESDQQRLPPGARLQASFESMRLTSRLTQVMAWLLAQKALHAGEITLTELASERFALSGEKVCADNESAESPDLPLRLRRLLDRSHSLYERIARLDAQVRPGGPSAAAPKNKNPAGAGAGRVIVVA